MTPSPQSPPTPEAAHHLRHVSSSAPAEHQRPEAKRPRAISWALVNFWLDAALLAAFLLLVWISGVLHLVFPAGPAGFGWTVLGQALTQWRNLQFFTLIGLGLGLLVHVMLHWSWICGLIRTRFFNRPGRDETGADTLWGVGFLVALLHLVGGGLLLAWVFKRPV